MMGKKMLKYGALVATGGMILQFGGCLGGNWQNLAWSAVTYAGLEFVTDNDGVFDLFQDDFGTGTQYDDRFTGPTRAEPDGFAVTDLGTGGD
ncbi:MAG: hypothetical protein ACYSVY_14490 [Planctomycetota bacterium]|jgi:hypothetical protein